MKSIARFLLFLVLILVVLSGFIFTINNTVEVPLWLGVGFAPRPLGVWILLAFTAGGLAGLLLGLGLWRRVQSRLQLRQLRLRLQQTEAELARLKQQAANSQQSHDAGLG
jgi:uncharacterized integral membrane protein